MASNLLMVSNFSSSTGYAWKMIGSCFNELGRDFISNGHRAIVCYPKVDSIPDYLKEKNIEVVEFDFGNASFIDLARFIRKHRIKLVYLIDRGSVSLKYAVLRLSGVRKIIVHDHTSSQRTPPKGIKRAIKILANKLKIISSDKVLVISEYVKHRQIEVSCVPFNKIITVLNGVDNNDYKPENKLDLNSIYNIPLNKKIVFCGGRANYYKGIHHFIQAADLLVNNRKRKDLFFLYCGDGPDLEKFKLQVKDLKLEKDFLCAGQVYNINRILPSVDICIVPSIWQEGFGLAVIEAMAAGKPVIASRVGGMAEIIDNRIDGFYIEPGDYAGIADLIERLVDDRGLYEKTSMAAYEKVITKYDIKEQQRAIIQIFHDLL